VVRSRQKMIVPKQSQKKDLRNPGFPSGCTREREGDEIRNSLGEERYRRAPTKRTNAGQDGKGGMKGEEQVKNGNRLKVNVGTSLVHHVTAGLEKD